MPYTRILVTILITSLITPKIWKPVYNIWLRKHLCCSDAPEASITNKPLTCSPGIIKPHSMRRSVYTCLQVSNTS